MTTTQSWRPRESVPVRYADDPVLLHERLLLLRKFQDDLLVMTPDREVQSLDFNSNELEEVVEFTRCRRFPFTAAIRRRSYLFEDAERGPPTAEEVDSALALAKPGTRITGKRGETPLPSATERTWVSLEYVPGEINVGDVVMLNAADPRAPGRALHTLRSGRVICVRELLAPWDPPPKSGDSGGRVIEAGDLVGGPESDARVLSPVQYDSQGNRWREFGEAIKIMHEEPMSDFPLEGDRTALWLLSYIARHGGTPDGRHTKWAAEQRVERDSVAYQVHDIIGFAMELAVSYDQLDVSNLASMELLARSYQIAEETNGSFRLEGYEHYIGRDKGASLRRGVALAPALAKHTTEKLSKEVEILKQRRKAREEAANAKKKPNP